MDRADVRDRHEAVQAMVVALDLAAQRSPLRSTHLFCAEVMKLAAKLAASRSAANNREREELGTLDVGQRRLRGLLEQLEDATADPTSVLDVLCIFVSVEVTRCIALRK